jgi:NADH-quinone oxidoreductase subunit H
MLAETNRTPFDLAEAEAELVAGYNVEYSGIVFALFFLGEYANMLFLSIYGSFFFLGGFFFSESDSFFFFVVKSLILAMFFIFVRATLPRYRYDQLMEIC